MDKKTKDTLSILQEECAEVTQAISKVLRFGIDTVYPKGSDSSNKNKLEEELGDLMAMVKLLVDGGTLNVESIIKASEQKLNKLKKWSTILDE